MFLASVDTQTIITGVVAIAGFIATFASGYFAHRWATGAERQRWVRDRRADIYLALLGAYFEARTIVEELLASERETAEVKTESEEVTRRFQASSTLVKESGRPEDVDRYSAEIHDFEAEADGLGKRHEELVTRTAAEEKRRDAHVEKLENLFTPIQFFGSERVKALSSEVQGHLTDLLIASLKGGPQDGNVYLVRWLELQIAMREELGITD